MLGNDTDPDGDRITARAFSDEGSQAVAGDAGRARPPGLVWDWTAAALGVLYALPAGVEVLNATCDAWVACVRRHDGGRVPIRGRSERLQR
jgi:hypothetical protein